MPSSLCGSEEFLVEYVVKNREDWLSKTRYIEIFRSRIERYNKFAISSYTCIYTRCPKSPLWMSVSLCWSNNSKFHVFTTKVERMKNPFERKLTLIAVFKTKTFINYTLKFFGEIV